MDLKIHVGGFQIIRDYLRNIRFFNLQGMELIENLDVTGFDKYLKDYGNTICGRHPIGVLLHTVRALMQQQRDEAATKPSLKFVQYAQSSKCRNMRDSSVSYASASLVI